MKPQQMLLKESILKQQHWFALLLTVFFLQLLACGSPETTPPQDSPGDTTKAITSGSYSVSDARNTREDCKAQRQLLQSYTIKLTGERIRVEEWKMEGKLRGDRFVLESRQTRDFSPEYDCALELKLRIEGKVTGPNQIDIKLSEVLSIEGSGHTECPDAAASLGYNEFSGLQCSIGRSFRLKKDGS
jgi:hypothetical protein